MQEWRLGSYELLRRLGEGGMAQVYLARDVRLGREVAVKVLDRTLAERPGFRERFLREARVAAALDHPNIVPLYDFGESGVLYLVMPFVSGGSLQELLNRTPFTMSAVATYGSQIADALAYAHQRNVVHRDVKPANMLLHADGRLMLSDFGLAKIIDQGNRIARPRNHPDAGTPEYMAPEQVNGHSDERSDIYALGVVLYLLLTSRLPFTGSSSNAVMEGHLYRMPESPRRLNPGISVAMEAVVLRALAKRPEDRFQRASELGAALLGALIAGTPSSPLSSISRPRSSASYPALPQVRVPYSPLGYDGRPQPGQLGQSGRQPRPRPANPTAPISSISLPDLPDLTHIARAREQRDGLDARDRATQPPAHMGQGSSQGSYVTEALPRLDRSGQPVGRPLDQPTDQPLDAGQTPTLFADPSLTPNASLSSQATTRLISGAQPGQSGNALSPQPGRLDAPPDPRAAYQARARSASGPTAPITPPGATAPIAATPNQRSVASQTSAAFGGVSPAAASNPWQSLQSAQRMGRPTGRLGQMQHLGQSAESAPTGAMGALGGAEWAPGSARPLAPMALAYPSSPTLPTLSAGAAPDPANIQAFASSDVSAQPTLAAPLSAFWRSPGAAGGDPDALDFAGTILPGPLSTPRAPQRAATSARRPDGERGAADSVGGERGQTWLVVTTLLIILLLVVGILLRWLQTGMPLFFH